MSFSNFTSHIKTCQHNLPLNQNGTSCRLCIYNTKCIHNMIENECNICKFKPRREVFSNNNIKIINSNNFFNDKSQLGNYVNPDTTNKQYSKINNVDPKEISGREINNRSKETNVNSFMKRSLYTVGFIETNNSKNMFLTSKNDENSYLGITTRGNRKLDDTNFNGDLHLRRSMLQPDFRQGNRFFEFKPTSTRRESYRNDGNESALKFQNQTEEMYKKMNYTQAYDKAAGINRG